MSVKGTDREALRADLRADLRDGLAYAYLTTLIVWLAAPLGREMLKPSPFHARAADAVSALANWDGIWYSRIVEQGYSFTPQGQSSVAFFPAFPLLGRALVALTDMRAELALVIVAQVCFAAACVLAAAYQRSRGADAIRHNAADNDAASRCELRRTYVLLAMGLLPAGLFLRMAYSESLFLLLTLAFVSGIDRRWHPLAVAWIAGFATATRPAGAALLPPLLWYLWTTTPESDANRRRHFLRRALCYGPVACWGIVAYTAYLAAAFGDPWAFVAAQYQWRLRPEVALGQRLIDLAILEPLASVYDAQSPGYWGRCSAGQSPLLCLAWANPLVFVGGAFLLALGGIRRWLSAAELLLGAGLLMIPYVTRGHEMCMASSGRFVCVIFPCYLVVAELLARAGSLAAGMLALAAVLLGVYAAGFAAGYFVI